MNRIAVVLIVVFGVASNACLASKEVIDDGEVGASPDGGATVSILAPNSDYSLQSGKPLYRVWYGTNRKPVDEVDPAKGFSDSRDILLHFGNAYVYIPKSHKFGSVGSSWIVRTFTLTDDRLKIERIQPLDDVQFYSYLHSSLAQKEPGHRKALVYIHGYNVTFREAIVRAAQIGFDLKVEGITALYSWPSKGTLLGYAADEATVESSDHFLTEFLARIALESNAEEVDVIAHSMGNRALLRAVRSLAPAMKSAGKKFGQIILAAPDVDVDVFTQFASIYPTFSSRTTMYVSSKDLAVLSSEFLHQYARVGFYPPVTTLPGIDTVQVSNVDLTLLGHGYYANAEPVLHDMFNLIQNNLSPHRRIRLFPHPSATKPEYWEIGP
jgi:esterase/lipase superfamily enzyme